MQSMPLWPTMFYSFDWPEHSKYAKELKAVCHDLETQQRNSNVSADIKHNLYESTFDFVTHPSPAVTEWSHWVKNCMFQASYDANKRNWPDKLNVQIELHESWCHITRDGGYHDMHVHPNSTWSCIYYLDCGDMSPTSKNGVNRFYNPNHTMYSDVGSRYISKDNSIDIVASPGMLVIFPSWIQHSAVPYHGKNNRYILSANCRVNLAT